jgi:hypothetical protein
VLNPKKKKIIKIKTGTEIKNKKWLGHSKIDA